MAMADTGIDWRRLQAKPAHNGGSEGHKDATKARICNG
jgi:hypothetical protein